MRYFYSLLLYLMLPFALFRQCLRAPRKAATRLPERLGYFASSEDPRPLIWLHAAALPELVAAQPFAERLLKTLPQYQLAVTTTAPAASARLRAVFGDRVFHVYAPWDTPPAVRRCLARLQPQLLILVETGLRPNRLQACARRGCPVLLANAHLTPQSVARYRRFPGLVQRMLAQVDVIAVQDAQTARRFRDLGASNERVVTLGSFGRECSSDTPGREMSSGVASERAHRGGAAGDRQESRCSAVDALSDQVLALLPEGRGAPVETLSIDLSRRERAARPAR